MNRLRIRAADEKHIRISGIPSVLVFCLRELPHILEKRDTPDARARLFATPTRDDAKINADYEMGYMERPLPPAI